jgi:fructan beta-fructosidase
MSDSTLRLLGPPILVAAFIVIIAQAARGDNDIVVADFEGSDYGIWKTAGEAFGNAPAHGTLPDQMEVSGFQGRGLVNSYLKGDGTVGMLTSPEFRVERPFINFLIGGGNHPGETCVNLLVDGKAIRSSTGADSEHLEWETWDVADLAGKTAQIEIVDKNTGGWGHILVDQIVQSSARKAAPPESAPLYHEWLRPLFHFTAAKNWLNDPNGLVFYKGEYHLFFQHNPSGITSGNLTWGHAVSTDLLHWKQLDNALGPDGLGLIYSGSAVVDWSNTSGFQTGDEKPLVAIYTSAGSKSPESQGKPFTQSIAYSNDSGRTWTKYKKNPVLAHVAGENRDPKVIWHAPTKRWIMALYLDGDKYALFASPNLKQWEKLSDLPPFGASECPDFFELPAAGQRRGPSPFLAGTAAAVVAKEKGTVPLASERAPLSSKWVQWGANNNYLLGGFDGMRFTRESGPHRFEFGGNFYAAQSYSDIPAADGRRIQIAWMNGGRYPKMPFNQQMSIPAELTLRQTPDGLRIARWPIRELDSLRGAHHSWTGTLAKGVNPLADIKGDLFDISAEIEPARNKHVTLTIRGTPLEYDAEKKELKLLGKTAPFAPTDGKLRLRIVVDRSSIEVFANDGLVTMSSCFIPSRDAKTSPLSLTGDGAQVTSLDVRDLKSCWDR